MRKFILGLASALIVFFVTSIDGSTINTTQLMFPCNAKAVSRIWVDEEIFWDSEKQGLMMLEECDMLELNVDWSESIVVEWFATTSTGDIATFRFRLYPSGYLAPEKNIPQSRRMDL